MNKVQLHSVKNLIFDLGGVIVDLSVEDTLKAFSEISNLDFKTIETNFVTRPEFEQYEKGFLSDEAFRDFIRNNYQVQTSDADIDACWNAMLLGLKPEKLDLLLRLKTRYKTFLLSNTNGIHLDYINKNILQKIAGHDNLDQYFHRAYYSHRMGMRKPDSEIFETVLKENGLEPTDTLFLDDNITNLEGAAKLGIQTQYIASSQMILELFQ